MSIRIIIVEDNLDKTQSLTEAVNEYCEVTPSIDCADNIQAARSLLKENQYDLLILDISLPMESGGTAAPRAGLELLGDIESRRNYKKPKNVVGMTAHQSLYDAAGTDFLSFAWPILFYDRSSDAWRNALEHCLRRIEAGRQTAADYRTDIAIASALYDTEFDAVRNLPWNWKQERLHGDHSIYLRGDFISQGRSRTVMATAAARMGIAEAAVMSSKLIYHSAPRYLAMTGVMAGVKDRVNIGDLIVADPCWDYGSGKWTTTTQGDKFEPAPYQMALSPTIRECFREISKDSQLLSRLHCSYQGAKPLHAPRIHMGPVGTGAGVIANENLIQGISAHNRKLLGIEMEAYGVLIAATESPSPRPDAFVVKGVCDFADSAKADDYQPYCAWLSARIVQELAESYLFN